MPRLSSLLLSVALLVSVVPSVVATPNVAAAQTDVERARARTLYTEGQRLFDAGDFEQALVKFEAAYAIVNNPVVLLGVASAQERLGHGSDARATLERYLRERPTAPDRADIEARIAALPAANAETPVAAATGTVVVSSDPAGAAVVVDGESSGAVTPTELTLTPGDHEIALALSGYELATRAVTVEGGASSEVSVALTEIAEAEPMDEGDEAEEETEEEVVEETPAPSSDPSAATWVTTAIAGVALVTGTVFGFIALSRQSDFDVAPTRALADEGEAFALAADLSFGVAIAAGITAIVLYATDRPAAPVEAEAPAEETTDEGEAAASASLGGPTFAAAPIVSPTGGGIALGMTF